jgi:hypothetical protein
MAYYANLDEDIEEWRVFQMVQPIFAEEHDWNYYPKTPIPEALSGGHFPNAASPDSKSIADKVANEQLTFQNFKNILRANMISLPRQCPTNTLSQAELVHCQQKLATLLNILEMFVHDRVIPAAAAGESAMNWAPGIPGWNQMREMANRVLTAMKTVLTNPMGESGISTRAQEASETPVVKDTNGMTQKYHRLKALGQLLEQDKDPVEYLILNQPLTCLERAWKDSSLVCEAFQAVRQNFKSSDLPGSILRVNEIVDAKWNKLECQQVPLQLYSLVDGGTSGCLGHQAKLKLDGGLLDGHVKPFELDVFVSPCPMLDSPNHAGWRHGHFTWSQE